MSTACSLSEAVVAWVVLQLQSLAEAPLEGGDSRGSALMRDLAAAATAAVAGGEGAAADPHEPAWAATLELGEELLQLAIMQWPVSRHSHEHRVSFVCVHGVTTCWVCSRWDYFHSHDSRELLEQCSPLVQHACFSRDTCV